MLIWLNMAWDARGPNTPLSSSIPAVSKSEREILGQAVVNLDHRILED